MSESIDVVVDGSACVGSETCVYMTGGLFGLDDEGKARFEGIGTADQEEVVVEAAESCPVMAITVRRLNTDEVLFP